MYSKYRLLYTLLGVQLCTHQVISLEGGGGGGGNSSVTDIRLVYIACEISKHLAKVFNNLLADLFAIS